MKDILLTIELYATYGIARLKLMHYWGLHPSRITEFKKRVRASECVPLKKKKQVFNLNTIMPAERDKVLSFARQNACYFHREMAWRMIDMNITFLSPSSVYRILKKAGLIREFKQKPRYASVHNYSNHAGAPDELWQADITYLRYRHKDVYQLSFIDVYSRFITLSTTLTDMSSATVSAIFNSFIEKNIICLPRRPRLQTDNGSCFIADDFKSVLKRYYLEHARIRPGAPTENAVIERWHKTFKELLAEYEPPAQFAELVLRTEQACYYYNYERYHKSLGYMTPYTFYRGDPQKIFKAREEKLAKAYIDRRYYNMSRSAV